MLFASFDPFSEFHRAFWSGDRSFAAARMDAIRRDNEIELRFDLPGVDSDSIEVTVDHGVLTVSARRSEEYTESEKPFIRERVMGSFTRRLRLSDSVDAEKIAASYDGGVLTVKVPFAERALPRRIEIGGAERPAVTA
jgi:HSP20 family protein